VFASRGCTAEAADTVADAKQEFDKTNAQAQKKLTQAEADAMARDAHALYAVEITQAEGRNKVAKEKCDVLTGPDKDACASKAAADLASEQSAALAKRDATLAQAARQE